MEKRGYGNGSVERRNIMVAEDDKDIRRFLMDFLPPKFPEHTFVSYQDGEELAMGLEEHLYQTDVVVTDNSMPGRSGMSVIGEYAGRGPRFIMTSADANEKDARQAGAFDFLQKPFRLEHLVDSIQRAIDAPQDLKVPEDSE